MKHSTSQLLAASLLLVLVAVRVLDRVDGEINVKLRPINAQPLGR